MKTLEKKEYKKELRQEIEESIKKLYLSCSIEGFRNYADYVSIYHKLSLDFIREFKNRVCWKEISIYQKLSKDFVLEFKDRVCWKSIEEYQNITKKNIKEYEEQQQLQKTRVKNKFQLIRF